jgi:hypothetical protein
VTAASEIWPVPVAWTRPPSYFSVYETFSYPDRLHNRSFEIYRGFECDLASIPRVVDLIIRPQELGELAPLVHDFLYYHGGKVYDSHGWFVTYTRYEADRLFYQIMLNTGVVPWKARAAYYAVRTFGSRPWRG